MSNLQSEGELYGLIDSYTDTIDYNTLTNRPEINNKVVEGTHNGRYYDLTESEIIDWIDYKDLPEETKKNGKIYYIRNVEECIEKTITNVAVASFNDGSSNPLKSLETEITPIQDLHGYDSPWAGGAGKNKINLADIVSLAGFVYNRAPVNVVANTYTLSFNFTGGTGSISISLRNGETIVSTLQDQPLVNGLNTFTMPTLSNNADSISLYAGIGGTYENFMLEEGSQATTYEPYSNICPISGRSSVEVTVADDISDPIIEETYEINLGQTVYGGKLNATIGKLTITNGYIASYNSETLPSTWISDRDEYIPNTTPTIGAEVVYALATPTILSIAPTEIRSLHGNNNIKADSGNIIELIYLSTTGEIENQIRTNDEIFGRA